MRCFFLRVISKRMRWCQKRLLDGLYPSRCLPESIHYLTWTGSSMNVLHEILFPLVRDKYIIHYFWLDWNPTKMSWIAREQYKNLRYSILFFVLLSKIFCNHASSSKSRAPSCANFLTNTDLIESQHLEPSVCRSS